LNKSNRLWPVFYREKNLRKHDEMSIIFSMYPTMTFLHQVVDVFVPAIKLYVICLFIFIPLASFFPSKSTQPLFHCDTVTDTIYWFLGIIYSIILQFILVILLISLYSPNTIHLLVQQGIAPITNLPLWLQAFISLLALDFLQYWVHRLFHLSPWLWKFHAIHHSSKHVDWLTAARFHPINFILYSTLLTALVFLLGFNPKVYAILSPFMMIYPAFVHANFNCSFGPLRYFLASPIFHRWHHTLLEEGGSKNFAPTFPFLDMIFGTYYDPAEVKPMNFGLSHEKVPRHFWGQLVYPFNKSKINSPY
jgi:sterol desaturase/sphingolipid hydroxylase (fatty acid hydroxylase superfamily)